MNRATRFVDSAALLLADESWLPRIFAMPKKVSARIQDHFVELTDPRRRKVTYPLINIVTIAICAVICGADDFVSIAEFGRKKRKWLAQFLDLRNGIPSHDRFNAILGAIKPAEFEACLLSWITALHEITAGQIVAIDGKTLRRSFDAASSKSAIHMVSAWATANQISLGQVVVDAKSNEITAIPQLLKILEIAGCLVTIDAMGCQTEIAQAILDAKADYVLAVKSNQRTLYDGLAWFFCYQRRVQLRRRAGQPSQDPRGRTWPPGNAIVLRVRCSRRSSRPPPLAKALGHWHGRQRDRARRQARATNSDTTS